VIASGMPQAGPPRSVPLPHSREIRLASGLRVIAFSRGELRESLHIPLISSLLMVNRGAAKDPPKLPGVAAMTSILRSMRSVLGSTARRVTMRTVPVPARRRPSFRRRSR